MLSSQSLDDYILSTPVGQPLSRLDVSIVLVLNNIMSSELTPNIDPFKPSDVEMLYFDASQVAQRLGSALGFSEETIGRFSQTIVSTPPHLVLEPGEPAIKALGSALESIESLEVKSKINPARFTPDMIAVTAVDWWLNAVEREFSEQDYSQMIEDGWIKLFHPDAHHKIKTSQIAAMIRFQHDLVRGLDLVADSIEQAVIPTTDAKLQPTDENDGPYGAPYLFPRTSISPEAGFNLHDAYRGWANGHYPISDDMFSELVWDIVKSRNAQERLATGLQAGTINDKQVAKANDCIHRGESAKQQLFRTYIALALNSTKSYPFIEYEDKVQITAMKLWELIDNFRPGFNQRQTISYITKSVQGNTLEAIYRCGTVMNASEDLMSGYAQAAREGKTEVRGVPVRRIWDLLHIDYLPNVDQVSEQIDRTTVPEMETPEESVVQAVAADSSRQLVGKALEKFFARAYDESSDPKSIRQQRERNIIFSNFGFDGTEPKTQVELGAELGVSKQRVHQIETEVLERMRRRGSPFLPLKHLLES